jgi:hypothetical protein
MLSAVFCCGEGGARTFPTGPPLALPHYIVEQERSNILLIYSASTLATTRGRRGKQGRLSYNSASAVPRTMKRKPNMIKLSLPRSPKINN